MGIGKFQPPTKSIPLNRSTKNSVQLITSARGPCHPVYQIWYKSTYWRLLGKWVKYNKNYFLFIPFLSGMRTGQTRGWIFTRDSSKDVKSRKEVPFGGLNDVPLNFGGKTPKNSNFGGVYRTFKPERQKFQTLITWKLLIRSTDHDEIFTGSAHHECTFVGGPMAPPQQIQDGGGRHL